MVEECTWLTEKGAPMVLLGDVLAKAAEKSYHYEGEHFLKVSSCFVLFVVYRVVFFFRESSFSFEYTEDYSSMVH